MHQLQGGSWHPHSQTCILYSRFTRSLALAEGGITYSSFCFLLSFVVFSIFQAWDKELKVFLVFFFFWHMFLCVCCNVGFHLSFIVLFFMHVVVVVVFGTFFVSVFSAVCFLLLILLFFVHGADFGKGRV